MATTQYPEYYYGSAYYHHHYSSQQQNAFGYPSGQYDCKNLNVNDAYNNYEYNSQNNYNDQWTQHYNTIPSTHQHHPAQPHYGSGVAGHHQQHLNMLNNQINDDYKNYSPASTHPASSPAAYTTNEFVDMSRSKTLHPASHYAGPTASAYNQQSSMPPTASISSIGKATANDSIISPQSYTPSSQLSKQTSTSSAAQSSRKRKIDNSASNDDSPALRALLSKPKRAKSSPYFYQSQGSISPASSIDNYPQNYQLPLETSVNLNQYNRTSSCSSGKEGYEQSIDDLHNQSNSSLDAKYTATSLFTPSEAVASPMSSFIDGISTPPSSPKENVCGKIDESSENVLWCDQQNGGKSTALKFWAANTKANHTHLFFSSTHRKEFETNTSNLHTLSDAGVGEGIQFQQILDTSKTHRNLTQSSVERASNQNMVSWFHPPPHSFCRISTISRWWWLLTINFPSLSKNQRFQNRRMKAKKDCGEKLLSPDLLFTDEPQIIQNYPTYQHSAMPPHHQHDFANVKSGSELTMPTTASYNHSLNDLMNINHEQQQTHLELSSFVW